MILPLLVALQGTAPDVRPALDSTLPGLLREHGVPGGAVAVVRGGVTTLAGYGLARLDDSVRVDPAVTVFRIGSVGKLFVASAVAHEVAVGRLSLDEDVRARVPEVLFGGADDGAITLRQLMTHTAGFDERLIGYAARAPREMRPLSEYLAERMPPRGWPAGRLVGYSNHGVSLAALVVARAAGVEFRDYARREVFAPRGMDRTFYLASDSSGRVPGQATGYRCAEGTCTTAAALYSHAYPVGLVYSTAADMGRYLGGLLSAAPTEERAILLHRHFTHDPALRGMGLGFFEQSWNGVTVFAHSGVVPGFTSLLVVVPERDAGFFVATNGSSTRFLAVLYERLMAELLGPRVATAFAPVPGKVSRFAGAYRMTRYAHNSVERFPLTFATGISVASAGDTLQVPFGGGRLAMLRVDSLRFREIGGEREVAFARDTRGRITHLYAPALVAGAELPAAFERTPWHEQPYFLNEYVSWLVMLPILVLIGWGLIAALFTVVRRLRGAGREREARPRPATPVLLAVAVAALFAWTGFGVIARSTRDLSRSEGIVFGLSRAQEVMLMLPYLHAGLALVLAGCVILVWQRAWFARTGRLALTLVAASAVLQLHFHIAWNYLPARW